MALYLEKQDLTFLKWSHIRSSSGTAGTFLKSESSLNGRKIYYKLSNFDPVKGVVGHECINEIIVDRLLSILGIEHLPYDLIYADIEINGKIFTTYLCASKDFKKRGESKAALDDYYRINSLPGENPYEFCKRNGWQKYVDEMIAVDFLILNRDRHGANIEVLRNARAKTIRIAPLFDHGLSLLFNCDSDEKAMVYDILEDKRCQNFIDSGSCYENLSLITDRENVFRGKLTPDDKEVLFEGLDGILSPVFFDAIWNMIWERYEIYENI